MLRPGRFQPGILYCFIASFDVVFIGNHGFNLGQNGLAFLVCLTACDQRIISPSSNNQGIITGVALCYAAFLPWAIYSLKPRFVAGST